MITSRDEIRQARRRTIALILAGGRGSRLMHLTEKRAKPAMFFGGKFRIIDFTLSNCINSGFRRISVLTQYKSHSLLRHLQRGWGGLRGEMNEFVELLPAQQQTEEGSWYKGTADAVWQNELILRSHRPKFVLVLAGDHVYKMDYSAMLEDHITSEADVTVSCIEVPRTSATGFGVMHVDENDRVIRFFEKPADPPPIPDQPDKALASMGIYIFNADFLFDELQRDAHDPASSHDFGRNIIPAVVPRARVMAHRFQRSCIYSQPGAEPYWRDVGTVDAFWAANIDLTALVPALNLYDSEWPIFTYQEQLPPAKFVHDRDDRRGMAVNSLVSGGCIVSGSTVRESLLFSKVHTHSHAVINQSVILPEVDVGSRAQLTRVVVDRGVRIPEGMVIGENPELDAQRFYRTEGGVTLVTAAMLRELGY
ncbi:MAG: glucose-1-phosphate adenylyltransferase [Rhodospirillaceae bacterium]|nr:glucose-1-phosphate adenylyltransferase [Rhodospirillaceae bacterium]